MDKQNQFIDWARGKGEFPFFKELSEISLPQIFPKLKSPYCKNMIIKITLKDNDGKIIAEKETINSFEMAGKNLKKLERYYKQYKKEPYNDNESFEKFEEETDDELDKETGSDYLEDYK